MESDLPGHLLVSIAEHPAEVKRITFARMVPNIRYNDISISLNQWSRGVHFQNSYPSVGTGNFSGKGQGKKKKVAAPLWKAIWRSFNKPKIELAYNPAILLLGIYPKEYAPGYDRATCTPMFTAALFTIANLWKLFRCLMMDEWIKKMWYIYIQWSFIQP
jgi:hypothetical protein